MIAAVILYILVASIILFAIYNKSEKILKSIKTFLEPRPHNTKTLWNIPGPLSLPFVGTKWIFLKKFQLSKLHEAYRSLHYDYGPIVLEVTANGIPVVSLFNQEDIEKVFKYPSRYPFRPPTEIAIKYRLTRPDRYASTGLANEQGPTWHHLRTKLTPHISTPRVLQSFVSPLNEIIDDFIELIRHKRNEEGIIEDFQAIADLFGLEATCMLVLGRRMGFLAKDLDLNPDHDVFKLAMAVKNMFIAFRDSYYGFGLWKYFPTKTYRNFVHNEELIYDLISELVDKTLREEELTSNDSDVRCVFHKILQADDLDLRDKKSAIIDFIAAGIQTLSNTMAFLLYYVTKSPEHQTNMFAELQECKGELNPETLTNCLYTKACIQEAFRICPTAFCIARILEKDMTLSGYSLNAGLVVLCHTQTACLDSSNFSRPNEFLPERWINTDENVISSKEPGAPMVLPFGFGKRTCPGKRFVELEVLMMISKLVSSFDIKYCGELDVQFEFLLTPKGPVNIAFIDR